jgi:NADH-quinone oxidoreductase subunit N
MNTIIVLGIFAIIAMYLGLFNLKRYALPVSLIGLLLALGTILTKQLGNFDGLLYGMVSFDNISQSYGAVMIIITCLIFVASRFYYKDEIEHLGDIYALFLFSLLGGIVLVSFQNLVMLFLGVEILSIPLYILAGSNRRNVNANEAGLKYFLLGSFASCFLLLGITIIYGITASFNLTTIAEFITANGDSLLLYVGCLLVLGAFIFKISAVPFHFWAPDVYQGSPTTLTSYLATVGKIAALGALLRFLNIGLQGIEPVWHHALWIVAIITMVVGSIITLSQDNMKRLLAYTGIANIGFILTAYVAMDAESHSYILYYFFGYSIATIAAFSVYSTIKNQTGVDTISGLKGLITNNRLLTFTLLIAMLSFAGIPPLAGFFGKFFIFSKALKAGEIMLVIVAVITSLISAFNYIRLMTHTVSNDGTAMQKINLSVGQRLFFVSSIIFVVLIGLFPDAVMGFFAGI